MVNRFLFSIGLTFLAFSIGSLFVLISLLHVSMPATGKIPLVQPVICGNHQCGGNGPPLLISDATIDPGLIIEYEWPKHMNINGSESISVALTVGRLPLSSEVSPTPIGNVSDRGKETLTPDSLTAEESSRCQGDARTCLLSNLFGNGYTMSIASAYMVATSFDVQLLGPVERSTDQPLIEWDWNISPKSVGLQVLTVGVTLQWTPTGTGGTTILRQLWESPIAIEVEKPFLDVGQLSLSSAASGIFGIVFTGVSIPWILDQRQQKREQKKQKIKFCRECGAENPEDFVYCNKCGQPRTPSLDATISAPPIQSSPSPTEEVLSSVGNAAGVQQTSGPSSSQEEGK